MTDDPALATMFTPISALGSGMMVVRGQCYERPVEAEAVRRAFPQAVGLGPACWLIDGPGTKVVVVEFGAVVYWAEGEAGLAQTVAVTERALDLSAARQGEREELAVRVGGADDAVTFREVRLKQLTREHLRLISEVVAKSAALRAAEKVVEGTITQNSGSVRQLSERGTIAASSKAVLRAVGFTLLMKERLLARLNVFDAPPETWDSEQLHRLHEQLQDHLDFRPRAAGLQAKLEYLSGVSGTLLGFLEHREGKRLEWIIIILIVIEVIFSTIHFFEPK